MYNNIKMNLFKLFNMLLLLFIGATLSSCSQDKDETNVNSEAKMPSNQIQVTKLGAYLEGTRAIQNGNEEVLKFTNEASLVSYVKDFEGMDEEERATFFKSISFDGLYETYNNADRQLDSIFDIDNDTEFLKAYTTFRNKYGSMFAYNDSDSCDLTLYLHNDEEPIKFFGSKSGYIIVGNKLRSSFPELTTTRAAAPIEPKFIGFDCNSTISEGRYRSDITLGFEKYSRVLNIRVASQKKKKVFGKTLYKKRYNTDYHADIMINGMKYCHTDVFHASNSHATIGPNGGIPIRIFGKNQVKFQIMNFTSGCCSHQKGNSKECTVDFSKINVW